MSALMNDSKNNRRVAGSLNPSEEYDMPSVTYRTQTRREQAPVAPAIGVCRNALERPHKASIVFQPLVPAPSLERIAPDIVQVPARGARQSDRHCGPANG